jgi:hypothetical protein
VAAARCDSIRRVCTDGAYSCNEMLLHFTARWGRLYIPEWMLRLQPRWHMTSTLSVIRSVSQLRRGCEYANIEKAVDRLRDKPALMLSGERDTYVIPRQTLNLHARTGQDAAGVWITGRVLLGARTAAPDGAPGARHDQCHERPAVLVTPGPLEGNDGRLTSFVMVSGPAILSRTLAAVLVGSVAGLARRAGERGA